jgi:hypothetical protein
VREWRGVVDDNGAKGEGKKKIEDERMSECQSPVLSRVTDFLSQLRGARLLSASTFHSIF